jgi:hypothetical protein
MDRKTGSFIMPQPVGAGLEKDGYWFGLTKKD